MTEVLIFAIGFVSGAVALFLYASDYEEPPEDELPDDLPGVH